LERIPSGQTLPPGIVERRQSPRRWGDPIQVHISDGQISGEPALGWILNRSRGGLGLSSSQPMAVGTFLNVRISNAPPTVPWVLLEVKSCHPRGGRWIVGCRFVYPPPEDVLLMFR
jgi:hypothetical protein